MMVISYDILLIGKKMIDVRHYDSFLTLNNRLYHFTVILFEI